ncbi:MAG TPA: hypothetical protein VF627_09640 [Abditibacterium sp.]|jgi:drug/metabolite transporter (DMT)-like permease
MNDYTPRFLFAALCLLCLIAIGCAAAWEMRRQKRAATISKRHFRWRMASAALWLLILGSLAYANLFLWPVGPDRAQMERMGQKFIAVVGGSMALMLIGFLLLFFDLYLTSKTRQIQNARLQIELGEMAQHEIEEAKRAHAEKQAQNARAVKKQDS